MLIFKLHESILHQVIYYLGLEDLQQLGDSCSRFHAMVFNNPRVWRPQVLFPAKDARVTDTFIKQLVPNITRHYGIQTLRLIQLPLTWLGYMCIFDQFAHSVDLIQVETSKPILKDLVYHLTVFAANLVVLQQDNLIPITFRQYSLDAAQYYRVVADLHFLGQPSISHITRLFTKGLASCRSKGTIMTIEDGPTRLAALDDPPFERLRQWQVVCTDDNQDYDRSAFDDNDYLVQLEALVSFLTGRMVITHPASPSIGNKRMLHPSELAAPLHQKHQKQNHPSPSFVSSPM